MPRSSSTLHISAMRTVLAMASRYCGSEPAMSAGDAMKSPSVSWRSRLGSASVLLDAMHMRTSCAFASDRFT